MCKFSESLMFQHSLWPRHKALEDVPLTSAGSKRGCVCVCLTHNMRVVLTDNNNTLWKAHLFYFCKIFIKIYILIHLKYSENLFFQRCKFWCELPFFNEKSMFDKKMDDSFFQWRVGFVGRHRDLSWEADVWGETKHGTDLSPALQLRDRCTCRPPPYGHATRMQCVCVCATERAYSQRLNYTKQKAWFHLVQYETKHTLFFFLSFSQRRLITFLWCRM